MILSEKLHQIVASYLQAPNTQIAHMHTGSPWLHVDMICLLIWNKTYDFFFKLLYFVAYGDGRMAGGKDWVYKTHAYTTTLSPVDVRPMQNHKRTDSIIPHDVGFDMIIGGLSIQRALGTNHPAGL